MEEPTNTGPSRHNRTVKERKRKRKERTVHRQETCLDTYGCLITINVLSLRPEVFQENDPVSVSGLFFENKVLKTDT